MVVRAIVLRELPAFRIVLYSDSRAPVLRQEVLGKEISGGSQWHFSYHWIPGQHDIEGNKIITKTMMISAKAMRTRRQRKIFDTLCASVLAFVRRAWRRYAGLLSDFKRCERPESGPLISIH